MESREIRTLRSMAWERAKGELSSMKQTFWDNGGNYKNFIDVLDKFIKTVEDRGLQE